MLMNFLCVPPCPLRLKFYRRDRREIHAKFAEVVALVAFYFITVIDELSRKYALPETIMNLASSNPALMSI